MTSGLIPCAIVALRPAAVSFAAFPCSSPVAFSEGSMACSTRGGIGRCARGKWRESRLGGEGRLDRAEISVQFFFSLSRLIDFSNSSRLVLFPFSELLSNRNAICSTLVYLAIQVACCYYSSTHILLAYHRTFPLIFPYSPLIAPCTVRLEWILAVSRRHRGDYDDDDDDDDTIVLSLSLFLC